ncbi:MAG: hypothetical protein HYT89_02105 [Candidatus Omnitrophica bacterium]|nr:hypothetical protein [Candidatus Omnitrophota bacterium]
MFFKIVIIHKPCAVDEILSGQGHEGFNDIFCDFGSVLQKNAERVKNGAAVFFNDRHVPEHQTTAHHFQEICECFLFWIGRIQLAADFSEVLSQSVHAGQHPAVEIGLLFEFVFGKSDGDNRMRQDDGRGSGVFLNRPYFISIARLRRQRFHAPCRRLFDPSKIAPSFPGGDQMIPVMLSH